MRRALLAGIIGGLVTVSVGAAGTVHLDAQVVIRSQALPGPNDPGRCLAFAFAQFPEIKGATAYSVQVKGSLGSHDVSGGGPPFPYDTYPYGGAVFTAPGGTHWFPLGSSSVGNGCAAAEAGLGGGRFTIASATATTSGNASTTTTTKTTTTTERAGGGPPPTCVGGCSNFSFHYDPTLAYDDTRTEVGAGCGTTPPRVTSSASLFSGLDEICELEIQATVPTPEIDKQKEIQDDLLKNQMERWKLLQDSQSELFDVQQDVTVNRAKSADKAFNGFDEYIRDTSAPADLTSLKATDTAIGSQFPAGSVKGVRLPAAASRAALPDHSRVFRAFYEPNPTAADVAAFNREVEIATSPVYSTERAIARLTLSFAVALGRRAISSDVTRAGTGPVVVLGTSHAKVPVGGTRKLVLGSTALGNRALRLLSVTGLSHPASASLKVSVGRAGKNATVTKPLQIG